MIDVMGVRMFCAEVEAVVELATAFLFGFVNMKGWVIVEVCGNT